MSDPRGKRVLFMSISAVPAHRDQSFEVSILHFRALSSSPGSHKLIPPPSFPSPSSLYFLSTFPFIPKRPCRNYEPQITSRRIWRPADHQLRFPKNQLIQPQEQVWTCHCCSSRTSILRRQPAQDSRRNKQPLLLKLMAFHKARNRMRPVSRLSTRKSLSGGIHLRFVFLGFPPSPLPFVSRPWRWLRRLFSRLQSPGPRTDRPLRSISSLLRN